MAGGITNTSVLLCISACFIIAQGSTKWLSKQQTTNRRVEITFGSKAILKCLIGQKKTSTNVWLKNGKTMKTSKHIREYMDGEVAVLVIRNIKVADEGIYNCGKNRGRGTEIIVGRKPQIVIGPTTQSIARGTSLQIECKASGFPKPFIRIYVGDKEVSRGRSYVSTSVVISQQNKTNINCTAINVHGVDKQGAVIAIFGKGSSVYKDYKTSIILISIGVVVGIILVICLVVIVFLIRRKSGRYHLKKSIEFFAGWHSNPHYCDKSVNTSCLEAESVDRMQPVYDIQANELNFVQLLFKGRRMQVFHANYFPVEKDRKASLVTVKAIKSTFDQNEVDRAVNILQDLRHENVLHLVGTCCNVLPSILVFESCLLGDLKTFLCQKDLRRFPAPEIEEPQTPYASAVLSSQDKLDVGTQICNGMKYLISKGYLHRDLATRNCLLTEDKTVKIADIEIGYELYPSDYYTCDVGMGEKMPIPLAWMPPEYITDREFTKQSCSWMFGITLWEVFSYSRNPFDQLNKEEITVKIITGDMPTCPMRCPRSVYNIMKDCWNLNAEKRPNMERMYSLLKSIQAGTRV